MSAGRRSPAGLPVRSTHGLPGESILCSDRSSRSPFIKAEWTRMHEKRGPPPDAAQQELAFTDRSITVFNAAIDRAGGKGTNASTEDLDFFFSERMTPLR